MLVTYRTTFRLHTALLRAMAGGLPSFVILLQESSQVIRTKEANTVSHLCDSPTLLDISLTTDAEDKR